MFTIPLINVQTDPLDALLAAVGYRLSMLANGNNEDFAALIDDRDVTIQLGSESSGIARYYQFNNGNFEQFNGEAKAPDLKIDFQDSATGVKLLTGGNTVAFMSAVQDGELKMEGDYSLLMWFNQLAKHIKPTIPEEVQPYIAKAQPYVEKAKPYVYKAGSMAKQIFDMAKQKLNG